MNVYQTSSVWRELPSGERLGILRWRGRISSSAMQIVLSVCASSLSILGPALFALHGLGMSRQNEVVVFNTGTAALFAIICGFIVAIRVLRFPLLRTVTYVASAFTSTF